mgnify:FL=1
MQIRRATLTDIDGINKLLYEVHKVHSDKRPDLFKVGSKKYTNEELEKNVVDDNRPIFVYVDNDDILGYAFCVFIKNNSNSLTDILTLYIDDLCVDENARGKKVGTSLYNYVLQFAKDAGCYNVTLNVWARNNSALKFYEKCGLSVQKIGLEKIL